VARTLVVNGDDFGLTPGVNAGILAAHERGILTSASLFANAPATDEAIRIASRTPTLGVGCHLTLVDGIPVCRPEEVPTLAPGGRFLDTWGSFIRAALARRIRLVEIERELHAQIERIVGSGISLTHLDAHKHVHAYPAVFSIVASLARRFAVNVVRVPCEPSPMRGVLQHIRHTVRRRQAIENLALAPWAWRDRRLLARNGLPPPPVFFGRALTGALTETTLISTLRRVPEGVSELMTHPGYPDAILNRLPTRLRAERAVEVDVLLSRAVAAAVEQERLVLVRHDGVAATASPEKRYVS